MKLWQKVSAEKESYNAALAEYKIQRTTFNNKRNTVIDVLNPAKLDIMCSHSLQAISDSWTTPGLTRGMRELIKLISVEFTNVTLAGEDVLRLMEGVYNTFHERFQFAQMEMPPLDFEGPRNKLKLLVYETEQFCKDPVNIVMTAKQFMVRRFWRMLVEQARKIFAEARSDTERWLAAVPLPLETQIRDHKAQLEARLATLAKINQRGGAIKEEVAKLEAERKKIQSQVNLITGLIMNVRSVGPAPDAAATGTGAPVASIAGAVDDAAFTETTRIFVPPAQPEYLETVKFSVPVKG